MPGHICAFAFEGRGAISRDKKPANLIYENVVLTWALLNLFLVPGAGIEPARCCQRGILSPVRLPIPPSRQWEANWTRRL
jgi:hypothetical protein